MNQRLHTRRTALALAGLAGLSALPAWAKPKTSQNDTFSEDEIVTAVAGFFGTTAKAAGEAVERIFRDHGRPTGYVAGEEVAGAIGVGLRYGDGTLFLKSGPRRRVYWQGPSIGFDTGGNASKVFTLAYNLRDPDMIFRRYPGVEGSAYFVAGIGVNYLRGDGITLAPMRAGVGLRAGANIGYLAFSRKRRVVPL